MLDTPHFKTLLHPNHESFRAEILRECVVPTTSHMSGQGDGASWWRECYQRCLPRLVLDQYGHEQYFGDVATLLISNLEVCTSIL